MKLNPDLYDTEVDKKPPKLSRKTIRKQDKQKFVPKYKDSRHRNTMLLRLQEER